MFTQVLKGLSGSKVSKVGSFRSNTDGFAVRTSLKAEEGYLYPLEKCCFFLPKPPTLILHDEVREPLRVLGAGEGLLRYSGFLVEDTCSVAVIVTEPAPLVLHGQVSS